MTGPYLSLADIIGFFWQKRRAVAAIWVAGMVTTCILLGLAKEQYEASMVVAAADQLGGGDNASSLMASINLPFGGRKDMAQEFITLARSVVIAERLERRHGLSRLIFSSYWDAQAGQWDMTRGGALAKVVRSLRSLFGLSNPSVITPWDVKYWIQDHIAFLQDKESKNWVIELRYTNPKLALQILTALYTETEGMLQERDGEELRRQIAYLEKRYSEVPQLALQQSLVTIRSSLEKQLMLRESGAPVAARIVVPPTITATPVSPRLGSFLVLGALSSLVAALALTTVIHAAAVAIRFRRNDRDGARATRL